MMRTSDHRLSTAAQIAALAAALLLLLRSSAGAAPEPRQGAEASALAVPEAAATLVVFNENDRDSAELARFYAGKRGVPPAQVVGLACAKTEEITREDYDRSIAEPLRRAFTANGWWKLPSPAGAEGPVVANKIRFVVLMRGIPLKIAHVAKYEGDKGGGPPAVAAVNAAAVDAELAVLGLRTRAISGALNNWYFRSFTPITEAGRPELMLVCRLDAPTPEIVRRMIEDTLVAERDGLAGLAYVDARGINEDGYAEGDAWLFALANAARRRGSPVVLDNGPALFPASYPLTRAALYFGWYAEHVSGPFVRPEFRFARGAVAVHIHSFSAATLRDPVRHWAGPLLAVGAAATLGNVYEPFLALTPQLDVFHDRLRAGFTFAESAYAAQRVLSWMTTCVGDPLYRPFKGAVTLEEQPASGEWADYRKNARLWFSTERAVGDAALRAAAAKNRSGVILEGLGLLQLSANDREAALKTFPDARELYGPGDDALRVATHEIIQLRAAGRDAEAQALARKMAAASPDAPAAEMLRALAAPPASANTPARKVTPARR